MLAAGVGGAIKRWMMRERDRTGGQNSRAGKIKIFMGLVGAGTAAARTIPIVMPYIFRMIGLFLSIRWSIAKYFRSCRKRLETEFG